MWQARVEPIAGRQSLRYVVVDADSKPLTYGDVLQLWGTDENFRLFCNETLAAAPQAGFRWETPPLTRSTIHRAFEFVLLDAPRIDRPPEPQAFAGHFDDDDGADEGVVVFENLGRNAILVAPSPRGPHSAYVHLAGFLRKGPAAQKDALWRVVASAMNERLSEKPVWLSTAGLGVAWLHMRLDDTPKYYGHGPYRQWP